MSTTAPQQAEAAAAQRRAAMRARGELPPWVEKGLVPVLFLAAAAALPFFFDSGSGFIGDCILALAYTVMALGLNIIVGFAGLLDLGYVAFFAIGAYTIGWLGSGFFSQVGNGEGWHIFVTGFAESLPGIHVNFLLVLVAAMILTTIAGIIIGLPTLRLRGDYIAIVTLAFGEIIGRLAVNGDEVRFSALPLVGGALENVVGPDQPVTAGRQGITPVDKVDLPFFDVFTSLNLRPWYWLALGLVAVVLFVNFRLRDSRLGRAWVALREDEVAAVSMGVPAVKTKLLAYGTGAAFGGISGAFLGSFNNTVNADQFQFFFSILILGMVILGGLGSIWGVVVGAIVLTFINFWLLPDVVNTLPREIGNAIGVTIDFDMSEINFGIYGFLLVIMMVLRPQGLVPERRRKMELSAEAETHDESVYTARA
jgi:branched-chain amino acid transport system permease protein